MKKYGTMEVKDGVIVKCKESELFQFWLDNEWYEIFDFPTYKEKCIEHGTVVVDD